MAKLISGRVKKIPSANVSNTRYQFLKLEEAEPDLGLPSSNGYVLTGYTDGTRAWAAGPAANVNWTSVNSHIIPAITNTFDIGSSQYAWRDLWLSGNSIKFASSNGSVAFNNSNTIVITNGAGNVIFTANANNIPITTATGKLLGGTGVTYDTANGIISIGQNVSTTANVTFGNLIVTGQSVFGNVITSNLNVTNVFILDTVNVTNTILSGNITTNLVTANAISANVWNNLYTANVKETSGNLYFTNARVYSNVITLLPTLAGTGIAISANGTISATGSPNLSNITTSNVAEGSNLYYTNTRVYSNVIALLPTLAGTGISINANGLISATGSTTLTTSNVAEGSNLYYTNTRVISTVTGTSLSNLTVTGNIIAGNLYVTNTFILDNINVTSNILSGGTVNTQQLVAGNINASNIIANAHTGNIWNGIYTANVIETTSNLYFTNARVYANTIALLPTLAGSGIAISANGTISATGSPNLSNITTSNVAEGSNLYYTNTRVISAVTGTSLSNLTVSGNIVVGNIISNSHTSNIWNNLYTANVIETAGNLYYTNARVYSNVIALLPTLAGTGISITANGVISATANVSSSVSGALANLTTSNIAEGSNLYYTNARVYSNVIALLPTLAGTGIAISANGTISATANITSSISGALANLTTSNIAEGSNLYYTNTRVLSYLSNSDISFGNLTIFGNLYLLGDVNEINSNTLYVDDKTITIAKRTPTAALADQAGIIVDGANASIIYTYNAGNDKFVINKGIDVYNGVINATNISATTWTGIYTSNVLENPSNLYFTNTRVYANVAPVLALKANITDLTTSNVVELNNLYYTNTRVYSNVAPILALKANITDLTTSNVVELNNLYYTNTRVYSNVAPILALKANITDLTTSNVVELNNLYYTNTRVYSNTVTLLPNYTGNVGAGNVIVQSTLYANAIILQNINVTSNILTGTIASGNSYSNTIVTSSIYSNTWLNLYTANVIETSGNLYYTNARVIGTVTPYLTTANVIESASNLYFTNSRAIAAITNTTLSNLTVGGNVITGNIIAAGGAGGTISGANLISTNTIIASIWTGIYTANVLESASNLYYTNARVYSNVISALPTYTGNSGSILTTSNQPYITALGTLANLSVSGNIGAGNVIVQSTLYANAIVLQNINVTSNILTGTIASGNSYSNTIVTGSIYSNTWLNLYTANVIETAGNLYYTNARVYSNVIGFLPSLAGTGISIAANGQISSNTNVSGSVSGTTLSNITVSGNVVAGNVITNSIQANVWTGIYTANVLESASNLYYTNARVYANVIPLLATKANVTDLTTSNVFELNNLYYTNSRVASYIQNANLNAAFGNLTVYGNLYLTGDINELSTNILYVDDKVITIAKNTPTAQLADQAGIIVDGANASILYNYNSGNDKFVINKGIDVLNGTLNVSSNAIVTGNLVASNIRTNSLIINGVELITGTGNITVNTISSNVWNGIYTANVIETAGNLYFTNARVIAAVANANLNLNNVTATFATVNGNAIVTGNLVASNVRTNSLIVNGVELVTGTGNITVNNISSNVWTNLYTANVIETSGNLYFTNARVIAAVANATISNLTVTGNIVNSGNIITGTGTGGSITGGYLVSATNIQGNTVLANTFVNTGIGVPEIDSTTNIIFNANGAIGGAVVIGTSPLRLRSYVISDIANLTPSIGDTIYNSNSATIQVWTGSAWTNNLSGLTTANVNETSNLYYTNARVYSNVIGFLPSLSGSGISIAANGQISANATTSSNVSFNNVSSNIWTNLYTANVIETAGNLYFTNIRVYANVAPLLALKANVVDLTTANVAELNNLYYTNSRVYSNVISLLPNYTGNYSGNNIYLQGALVANAIILQNINVTSNILTGTVASGNSYSNTTVTNTIYANTWLNLYTANVIETAGNLYYTNARVYSNVIGFLPSLAGTGITIAANGQISANVTTPTGTAFSNLTVTGNVVAGNVITNTITSNIWNGIYTANVIETAGNLYFTNSRSRSSISAGDTSIIYDAANGTIRANTTTVTTTITQVQTVVNNLSTSNVTEGTNLYYTNVRVYSNVITLLPTLAGTGITIDANGVISANTVATVTAFSNITVTGNISAGNIADAGIITTNAINANIWSGIYTANVIETVGNLYYTNARVIGTVTPYLTTANVIEIASNLYFTNTRAVTAITPYLTTSNVIETAGNLYYTNTRVISAITNTTLSNISVASNVVVGAGGTISGANLISGTVIQGSQWQGIYTSNVIETSSNLYYTDTRARNALSGGTGVTYYNSNGQISIGQDVSQTANVVFNSATILGNLTVLGNSITFLANTFTVTDSLIELGAGNSGDALDIGFYGLYNTGIVRYSGMFRDASDGKFKFFSNLTTKPTNILIDTANASFRYGTLVVDHLEGNVTGYVSTIGNFSTTNLVEGINLYYTNARAQSAITALDNSIIYYQSNGGIQANVSYITSTISSSVSGLTTANVTEVASNLYYTNARVYANVTSLLPTYTGNITAGNIATTGVVSYGNVTAGPKVVQIYNSATNSLDTIFL